MTVWWSHFQELLLSASPRSSAVTSARKRSRGAEYLCDVIYDRSEIAAPAQQFTTSAAM
jgi:hypothetical protein